MPYWYHAVFTTGSDMGMETEERQEVNLQIYRAQLLSPAVRAGAGAGGAAQMWPSGMDNRQSFLHLQPTLKWQAGWWKYEHAGIY